MDSQRAADMMAAAFVGTDGQAISGGASAAGVGASSTSPAMRSPASGVVPAAFPHPPPPAGLIPAFLKKTYDMLETPELKEYVHWGRDGGSIVIKKVLVAAIQCGSCSVCLTATARATRLPTLATKLYLGFSSTETMARS